MENEPNDWLGSADKEMFMAGRDAITTDRNGRTVDDLINWIVEDAQYHSSEYLQETKVDCEGE